jgi:hypothetical protein
MVRLAIKHWSAYRYREPVGLGPRRLMLRRRESCDVILIAFEVAITPDTHVTWAQDVFGNAVATAAFSALSNSLVIESVAELQLETAAWPVFDIAAAAISYRFRCADDEWTDLDALAVQTYLDPAGRFSNWARAFVARNPSDTLSLLKDLSAGVSGWIG